MELTPIDSEETFHKTGYNERERRDLANGNGKNKDKDKGKIERRENKRAKERKKEKKRKVTHTTATSCVLPFGSHSVQHRSRGSKDFGRNLSQTARRQ